MTKLAFFGAGGKMGRMISKRLSDSGLFDLRCVEIAEEGIEALEEIGLKVIPAEEAVSDADAVVFAVPDADVLGITHEIVPQVPSGTLIVMLDPCAAHSGRLPERDDIAYFVSHPCHHSFLEKERGEYIVTALHQGEEKDYELGVEIAKTMYGRVLGVHRLTVAQIVLLEPAISETVAGACLAIIREGFDEVVRQGVPEKAAFDFLMGHITATIGVLFGNRGFFSDGAYRIMDLGKRLVIKEDWMKALTPESIQKQVLTVVTDDRYAQDL
jgi:ketol-acid reductoisomerase